jgi:hypothetical protein
MMAAAMRNRPNIRLHPTLVTARTSVLASWEESIYAQFRRPIRLAAHDAVRPQLAIWRCQAVGIDVYGYFTCTRFRNCWFSWQMNSIISVSTMIS